MYIIEMVDDWDRTIKTWIVNSSEEEVINFVNTMNSNLRDKLSEEYYFYYRKEEISDLPTEEEIRDILSLCDFESPMIGINSTGLTNEMVSNWDVTKVTDMSGLFKDFK